MRTNFLFVRVSIGNSVSIHDAKIYDDRKTVPIPAVIFGANSSTRLTGTANYGGKYYAYFPVPENAFPAPIGKKVAYIELSPEEFGDLASKKFTLTVEKAEKPEEYVKFLPGYFTRIKKIEAEEILPESPVIEAEAVITEIPEEITESVIRENPDSAESEIPVKEEPVKAPNRRERRKNRA